MQRTYFDVNSIAAGNLPAASSCSTLQHPAASELHRSLTLEALLRQTEAPNLCLDVPTYSPSKYAKRIQERLVSLCFISILHDIAI